MNALQNLPDPDELVLVPLTQTPAEVHVRAPDALLPPLRLKPTRQHGEPLGVPREMRSGALLGRAALADVRNTQVVMNAKADVLAVWEQPDRSGVGIWANRFVAGQSWGTAICIQPGVGGQAFDPQIAIDANGNAIVLWRQAQGAHCHVWASHFAPDEGWSIPELIEQMHSHSVWESRCPRLSMNTSGGAVAVWIELEGSVTRFWAKRYELGIGWRAAQEMDANKAGHADRPSVITNASGCATVVWQQFDGIRSNIWACEYTPQTGWGPTNAIENPNDGGAFNPQLVLDDRGQCVVIWEQYDGVHWSIWSNNKRMNANWGDAQPIDCETSGHAHAPQMVSDNRGGVWAVWMHRDGATTSIWVNQFLPGLGWQGAERIECTQDEQVYEPQVSVGADGRVTALWWRTDAIGHNCLWASRCEESFAWSTPQAVSFASMGGSALEPQIVVDENSLAIAVWRQLDSTRDGVWANSQW